MNVYDFDKTIYSGDCTLDFWRFCVKKFPRILYTLPNAILFGILFQLKMCKRERFKEKFYKFLAYIPDVGYEVQLFWDTHIHSIRSFYRDKHKPDDLVISASPDFLIREVCRRLQIAYIASKVDPSSGKLIGLNCRGKEKLRRFQEEYPDAIIENFYSDSLSDSPLAKQSRNAFLIKNGQMKPWPQDSLSGLY